MKIVRRKKKYYVQLVSRVVLIVVCGLLCFGIGVLLMKVNYKKVSQEQRTYLCLLKHDVEAGSVLKESDVREVSVLSEEEEIAPMQMEKCVGKQVKTSLRKGTIISEDLICKENATLERVRKISYEYIKNTDALSKGNFVDVRISFPNGADFILLSKKEVLQVKQRDNGVSQELWMSLTEEEILRMSSGVVDAYLFDGAYIYATLYLNEMQEESIVNYPVNEVVEELIQKDPNIISIAQNQKTLELRSKIYENTCGHLASEEEGEVNVQEGLLYFE